ncbi:MAG: outer membrane lipoprotein LolB [Piscinibacter sp.]
MRRRALLGALPLAALLSACASLPADTTRPVGDRLAGRLSLKVDAAGSEDARSVVASFELQGAPEAGRLDLSTPLGTVMAQARWAPGRVVLVTPQGEAPYPSLDALTREVLGESLPVAALFDWLHGRPWPGAAHVAEPPGFRQLGWTVDLARFADDTIVAMRAQAPTVTVRVKLDRS